MDPQQLQMLMQMLGQQQSQGQPQIPNAQMGMPQRPQVQPMSAPPAPQAQPGLGQQVAQTGVSSGVAAGATAINPAFGILAQMIMPYLLQSMFGKQKQQMPSAQVISYPR